MALEKSTCLGRCPPRPGTSVERVHLKVTAGWASLAQASCDTQTFQHLLCARHETQPRGCPQGAHSALGRPMTVNHVRGHHGGCLNQAGRASRRRGPRARQQGRGGQDVEPARAESEDTAHTVWTRLSLFQTCRESQILPGTLTWVLLVPADRWMWSRAGWGAARGHLLECVTVPVRWV